MLRQAFVVEAVFLQAAELEILDQHVGCRHQLAHCLGAFRRREVDRHRALAAVAGMVVGGRQVLAVLARDEGRAPFAGVVAAVGVLDLDHVGAEIGQQLAGPRTCQDAGKLDHADAFERGF